MADFIKKFFSFSVGPVGGAVISLITIPVTTYFISPTEFGKAGLFTMVYGLVITLSYLGIDQSYSREYHYSSNKKLLFQNSIIFPLLISIVLLIILTLNKQLFSIFIFGDSSYSYISILFGLAVIFGVFERFILMSIRMEEKALEYSMFSILLKIVILIVTLFLIFSGERDFKVVVYSTLFGQMVGDLYLIIRYKSLFKDIKTKNFSWILIKTLLKFGFPLLISVSVNYLLNTTGSLFLRAYGNFEDLGIYTAGQKIANFLNLIQVSFTSFWVPLSYRWHKEGRTQIHFQIISDILLFIATIGFFTLAFLKRYITLLLSADYSDSQYIICFLALVPILYTLSETTTLGIVFSKKSYLNIYVSLFSILTCLIGSIILVPRLLSVGAAFAIAVSYIIFYLSRTYFSKKNKFEIKIGKQTIQIIILLITSLANAYNYDYIIFVNIFLLVISLINQRNIFDNIMDIKNNPQNYNFS
ncbi:lipopolysaccharide biosynthesis protein [Enterococcus dongliensis]|uniref:lipopolysaccharide biosynthesis protein n=1 Tax=Enterococcus dongliensis TaxID=2559925 RepID=UPI002890AD9C|nr:oligosaccharide flippase family protein [Enterococcus dongliensis]MDT2671918.1 oligosaccharide flippase family protein [Enterococcus dongliensis]